MYKVLEILTPMVAQCVLNQYSRYLLSFNVIYNTDFHVNDDMQVCGFD
jgi:hypothetical protein